MAHLKWSEAELATLKEIYLSATQEELCNAFPNRTYIAIKTMATVQKWSNARRNWSLAEKDKLKAIHGASSGWVEVVQKMNGLPDDVVFDFESSELDYTIQSIKYMARRLKLRAYQPLWTAAEDDVLRQYWTWTAYEISNIFQGPEFPDLNPRTEAAVTSRKEYLVEQWTHWQAYFPRKEWELLLLENHFDTSHGESSYFAWAMIIPTNDNNATLVYVDNTHTLYFNWQMTQHLRARVHFAIPCDLDYTPINRQPHEAYKKLKAQLNILSPSLDKL